VEAIAEAFKVLNHRNNLIPNATFGSGAYPSVPRSTFGVRTAVRDPRQVQLIKEKTRKFTKFSRYKRSFPSKHKSTEDARPQPNSGQSAQSAPLY
jgi:hypothetical protein